MNSNPRSTAHLTAHMIAALLALSSAGCQSTVSSPTSALEAYADAVRDRDAGEVFAMLDEEARMGMDEETFETYFRENYDLISAQADALAASASREEALEVIAEVPLGTTRAAALRYQRGDWYMDQTTPGGVSLQTPRDTLAAFVAALDEEDLRALLALLSQNRRGAVVGEFSALRESIASGLDGGLVTRGQRAVLKLDNGDKIVLVQEEGEWRIESFERGRQ